MSPRHRRRQRGAMIVPVLICFVLIMLISAALLQFVVAERVLNRQEERRLQAEWLAEAGLERAAARLSESRDYQGETWDIAAKELGGQDAGRVTITVETKKGERALRQVTVLADYPVVPERRARHRRSLEIDLGPDSNSTKGNTP